MSDYNFVPYFLTEPIYIINEPVVGLSHHLEEPDNDVPVLAESEDFELEKKDLNIRSRGGFNKKILILVDDSHPEVLNITDTEFLLKILKAVQLSEDDVAIVNIHSLNKNFLPLLKEQYDYRVMIIFGIEAVSLTDNAPKYKIIEDSGARILFADTLSDIDHDKQKKLKLWENLQLLFIMK